MGSDTHLSYPSPMKFQELGHVHIDGKEWSYGWGRTDKHSDGECDYKNNRIVVSRESTNPLLVVVAHEVLHMCFPDITEEAITDTAEIIEYIYNKFSEQPS